MYSTWTGTLTLNGRDGRFGILWISYIPTLSLIIYSQVGPVKSWSIHLWRDATISNAINIYERSGRESYIGRRTELMAGPNYAPPAIEHLLPGQTTYQII